MAGRIVVGVDGSTNARRALRYALAEARRRDARVEVVHVYRRFDPGMATIYGPTHPVRTRDDLQQQGLEIIEHAIAIAPDDVQVDRIAVPGSAGDQLVRIAQGADLLVVGSRGRGAVAGLLLGSVSQHVAAHAPCPVLVVPAAATATDAAA